MIRINLSYKEEPLSLMERIARSKAVRRTQDWYSVLKMNVTASLEKHSLKRALVKDDPPPALSFLPKNYFSLPSFSVPAWVKKGLVLTTASLIGLLGGMGVTAYYVNHRPSVKLGDRIAAASTYHPNLNDGVEKATLGILTESQLHRLAEELKPKPLNSLFLSGLEQIVEEFTEKTAICYSLELREVPNPLNQSRYFGHLKWAEMPDTDYMRTRKSWTNFGATELINSVALAACATNVYYSYAGYYPVLTVGDLSGASGGRLPPHISHRTGLDIDIGHYWYEKGEYRNGFRGLSLKMLTPETLEANWRFVKAVQDASQSEVEYIFWSQRYVYPLKEYIMERYGKEEWQKYGKAFYPDRSHGDHMHIRIEIPPKPVEEEKKEKCC